MDYEEQRGSDAEPGMPDSDSADASSTEDLGSESALMNNEFDSAPTPPEWPAADLQRAEDEARASAEADAAALDSTVMGSTALDSTATMDAAALDDETMDAGDDSDAPVQLDDADAAAAPMAQHLKAENINLSQGGVQSIEASNVTFSQGGAGKVNADTMSVEQSGVGLARVNTLTLGSGASAFAVVADKATVEEGSNTFLVISRSFDGETRPTIDWRGAMAFGAGLGLVISILRRLR